MRVGPHGPCMAQEGRTEDNSWEQSALVFPHHVGLGNQAQVVRFDCKCLYPLSHLVGSPSPSLPTKQAMKPRVVSDFSLRCAGQCHQQES